MKNKYYWPIQVFFFVGIIALPFPWDMFTLAVGIAFNTMVYLDDRRNRND